MTRVVVTGYAALDHVVLLAGVPVPGTTTRILDRPADAWPRIGGGPAYVGIALVANGVADTVALSWVGADASGEAYRTALAARGVCCDGIVTVPGTCTPVSVMAYEPDGGCMCLYDPGLPEPGLSPAQAALLASADWVCVTVGPPAVTDAVLDSIPETTRLAWAVKRDARAVSRGQAARLTRRADLLCFSRAEAAFVAAAREQADALRPGAVCVETRGAEGAVVSWNGRQATLPATPVRVLDPTGAGDTLVGGVIAALIAAPDDPVAAVRAGIRAAADMLRERERSEAP